MIYLIIDYIHTQTKTQHHYTNIHEHHKRKIQNQVLRHIS